MPTSGTARRYAQAAFAIALDRGEIEAWREGLRTLAELFSVPDMQLLLASPRVPLGEKQGILDQHLGTVGPLVRNLATLLVRKGRADQAGAILHSFEEMVDAHQGMVPASVTTAVPLDPTLEAQVRAMLQRRVEGQLRLELHVDPSIIGGIVARVGDKLLDGSTRTRLREMRERLRASALLEV